MLLRNWQLEIGNYSKEKPQKQHMPVAAGCCCNPPEAPGIRELLAAPREGASGAWPGAADHPWPCDSKRHVSWA